MSWAMLLRIDILVSESWKPILAGTPLWASPSPLSLFFYVPSLWRTAFASFGTCHIKFIGRFHRQSVTKRRLPVLPTALGHMLQVASGPRRAKVSLSSLSLAL